MARLRRFLMLERERTAGSDPAAPAVSGRFEAIGPPAAAPAPDPFAPPPDPDVVLEVEAPARPAPPPREEALAAEIAAMAVERDEMGAPPVAERYPRMIDRLAALAAVGPLAGWSPRARVRLVAGAGAGAIAALSLVGGLGPRLLQGALALLLFSLFIRS